MQLNRSPWCEDPYEVHANRHERVAAKHVDHIVPLKDGGTHAFSNLQSLCRSCHSRKTALEDGRWGD